MKTGIFPGNFQPFHVGHMLVVKGMEQAMDRVVIAICTGVDPDRIFEKELVQEMISEALLSDDILDAEIIFVEDCEDDGEWIDRILEASGNPENPVIWSGNEEVQKIVHEASIELKEIKHAPGFVSAEIREMIQSGGDAWRTKVSPAVANVIRKQM